GPQLEPSFYRAWIRSSGLTVWHNFRGNFNRRNAPRTLRSCRRRFQNHVLTTLILGNDLLCRSFEDHSALLKDDSTISPPRRMSTPCDSCTSALRTWRHYDRAARRGVPGGANS